mmetsp:Transcript_5891/g.8337  ORF Transcript_5891/g.8337 Transcript_5891/m.8337 type:complete len:281 (+) Transcript_5891:163-1005(+)
MSTSKEEAAASNKKRKAMDESTTTVKSKKSSKLNGNGKKDKPASNGKSTPSSTTSENSAAAAAAAANSLELEKANDGYKPLSLEDIKGRIKSLCERVPNVPTDGLDPDDEGQIKHWATQLQAVIEEFNLLVCCISAATYKWQSERSGAADQNLSVLSAELANSQDQISSTVTPRLTNVLAPVVDLVVDKVVTLKKKDKTTNGTTTSDADAQEEQEVKQNHYVRKQVDPSFLKLCATILSRNAPMIRQVVLCNFHKIDKCMTDYLHAQVKDSQHDSRGFAY